MKETIDVGIKTTGQAGEKAAGDKSDGLLAGDIDPHGFSGDFIFAD